MDGIFTWLNKVVFGISDAQATKVRSEGVDTITGIADFIQWGLKWFQTNPMYALGAILLLGIVKSPSGGLKIGKMFELKA